MASKFEELAKSLTEGEDRSLPGLAAIIADEAGDIKYSNSFGSSASGPVTIDSPMWVASCTKIMTTVAVLQCVEKGLINLDDDIGGILHEYAEPDIVLGFDDKSGQPQMGKAKNKVTMRRLLTHSSGLGYDTFNPVLIRWREALNKPPVPKISAISQVNLPLTFEPGNGFSYGVGLDWAGHAVERVNGNIGLGDYMKTHIWDPLGMKNTSFNWKEAETELNPMTEMVARSSTGELTPSPESKPAAEPTNDMGGSGSYSCASDFIKVLVSILKNDGKLLKPETVDDMFKPQLEDRQYIRSMLSIPEIYPGMTAGMPFGKEFDHSLGGLLAMEETPGRRSKGTLTWGGVPNLFWWIDREGGTCGIFAIQIFPFGDPTTLSVFEELEKMAWERFSKKSLSA